MLTQSLDRQTVNNHVMKLQPKSYSRFYWWRRFKSHKRLHNYKPLYDKIVNGDYELSSYYYQAANENFLLQDKLVGVKYKEDKIEYESLYNKRKAKLLEDFQREETELLKDLKLDFCRTFGLSIDKIESIMETFDGTTLELYHFIKNRQYE